MTSTTTRAGLLVQLALFTALVLGAETALDAGTAHAGQGAGVLDALRVLTNPLLLAVPWLIWAGRGGRLGKFGLALSRRWGLAVGVGAAFFALHLVDAVFVRDLYEPFLLDLLGGDPDAHGDRYAHLRGDLTETLRWIGLVWLFAALGEELFFRGLMLTQAERLIGGPLGALLGVVLSAIVFGLMHAPVGAWQVVSSTIAALAFYTPAYLLSGRNLLAPILAHGLWNTFGLTMIYLGAS